MPLYLREADVEALLSPADAVEAVEACFARIARGVVGSPPRTGLGLDGGRLGVAAAADLELGVAGLRSSASFREAGAAELVVLLAADRPEVLAVLEAGRLGQLRAGATSAVAACRLVGRGARSLGVIGCGRQAVGHVECVRTALPGIERVVAYCRTPERLAAFCRRLGAEPAEYGRAAAVQDVVVTATSSRDPVLRGEWLRPGALVCATGATSSEARELDNSTPASATTTSSSSRASVSPPGISPWRGSPWSVPGSAGSAWPSRRGARSRRPRCAPCPRRRRG